MKLLFVCAISFIALAQDIVKPSPIGHKRSQEVAQANVTPDFPKKADNTPITPGGDTGTACFYRQKVALPGEPEPPKEGLSATSPTFPIGTKVKVTNLGNKKTVVVTITGHSNGTERILCVSEPAAEQLAFTKMGTAQVKVEKQ